MFSKDKIKKKNNFPIPVVRFPQYLSQQYIISFILPDFFSYEFNFNKDICDVKPLSTPSNYMLTCHHFTS